jgi:hypothetical protein
MAVGHKKQAGAMVYLMEELGDARLRCDQLQRYIARAAKLIEKSEHKDHFFEVAGDLVRGIPETVFKLHKSLQAVALAAGRIDYEEIKQDLRPEKAEELERVLQDVRIRHVQRRSEPMKPIEALNALKALNVKVAKTGKFPLSEALALVAALEEGLAKDASAAADFEKLAHLLSNPPEGSQGPSRQRLAQILRHVVANHISREDLTALRVTASAWEKQELEEMEKLLKDKGYNPRDAKKLQKEGVGPEELTKRLKVKSGEKGSLEYTHGLKKKADDDFGDREAKGGLSIQDLNRLKQSLEDIVVEAKKDKNKAIESLAQKALKQVKIASSDDDKQSRFEEGKPADPTKDMSEEDAQKWKDNTEEHKDRFKKEALSAEPQKLFKAMGESVDALLHARVKTRQVQEMLTEVYRDASGVIFTDNYNDAFIKSVAAKLYELDHSIGDAFRDIERSEKSLKGKLKKAADDEDKQSRFEEGKPADPTENMSEEDAQKWKDNTDEYGDKLKKAAEDDKQSRFEEGKPADPTKNMSDEDAQEWKDNTEEHKDNFKKDAALAWKAGV